MGNVVFFNDLKRKLEWHPATYKEIQERFPDGLPKERSIKVKLKSEKDLFIKIWETDHILITKTKQKEEM